MIPAAGGDTARKVFLAEHGATLGLLIQGLFQRWGYGVTLANRAAHVPRTFGKGAFDLAVLDAEFPDADQIAAACHDAALPVVAILSGEMALEGATAEVAMPITAASLHAAVLQCFEPAGDERGGIDLNVIAMLWGTARDPRFLRVAAVFVTELEGFVRQLPALLTADSRRELERLAHSIKGASAHVGAAAVGAAAAELEAASLTGRDDALRLLAARIESASGLAIDALRTIIAEGEA